MGIWLESLKECVEGSLLWCGYFVVVVSLFSYTQSAGHECLMY